MRLHATGPRGWRSLAAIAMALACAAAIIAVWWLYGVPIAAVLAVVLWPALPLIERFRQGGGKRTV